jgi:hypothetical protein
MSVNFFHKIVLLFERKCEQVKRLSEVIEAERIDNPSAFSGEHDILSNDIWQNDIWQNNVWKNDICQSIIQTNNIWQK